MVSDALDGPSWSIWENSNFYWNSAAREEGR